MLIYPSGWRRTLGKRLYLNCDKISKKYFFFRLHQHTLNKIAYYIPFNENFSLCHLFVSGPYVLVSSYNGIIKNALYLFIYFFILFLDLFNRRFFYFSFWFEINIIFSFIPSLVFVTGLLMTYLPHITNGFKLLFSPTFNTEID